MGTVTEMTRQSGEILCVRRGERKAEKGEEKAPGVLGSAIFLPLKMRHFLQDVHVETRRLCVLHGM